jgi:gas vesicle protein
VITNFGGGGLLGPGGNGDFGGETSGGGGILGGLGLSAGGGAGAGATLPAGAGPGGAAGGPLAGLLGKLFSNSLGPISGSMLATGGIALLASTFRGGGILNGLGGALGGAMTGFAIAGPIGALIGGIAGFIAGIWGKSTKKARLAIEADIKQKSKIIEDSYNLFQTDYNGATTALEQLRQQGVDALKQAGVKDINRSRVGHVDQWVDKAEKEIDATQAERNRRAALAFGPAEFRVGGFVGPGSGGAIPSWFAGTAMHFASGGAVPAILHSGEYVVRPEAVASFGRGRLDSINSGGTGGDTHFHVTINAIDAKSFDQFLGEGNGIGKIMKHIRRGSYEGRW